MKVVVPKKFLIVFLSLCVILVASSTSYAKFHPYLVPEISSEQIIYSRDSQMIEAARIAESHARKKSRRRCWRAVKRAMLEAKAIDERPTSRYAKQAGEELENKFGFKKIDIADPFDAPVGAVLVYGGRGAGHVELRTDEGFVSDFISQKPSNRPLIGVYVRI